MGVQKEYEKKSTAIKGGSVCLRGFTGQEKVDIEDKLKHAGFRITFSMSTTLKSAMPHKIDTHHAHQSADHALTTRAGWGNKCHPECSP